MPPAGALIAVVVAIIGLEFAALLAAACTQRWHRLARIMLPGTAAGLFLALALRELHAGGPWLPLWLTGAGAAHGLDWWQRRRKGADPAG